jgi:Spy/CpxP family protein refolding chaperone
MKAIPSLVVACLVAFAPPALAQSPAAGASDAPRIQKFREQVRADPKAVVAKNLNLTESESKAFWPAYDECHVKLDGAQRRGNRAVVDYVNAGDNVTDANAKQIAKNLLDADIDAARAMKSCFERVAKVLPGKKAARFLQIESKMRALVRFDTAAAIPLVD